MDAQDGLGPGGSCLGGLEAAPAPEPIVINGVIQGPYE